MPQIKKIECTGWPAVASILNNNTNTLCIVERVSDELFLVEVYLCEEKRMIAP